MGVLTVNGPGSGAGANVGLAGNPRANLWSDHNFLRLVVQRSLFTMVNDSSAAVQPETVQQPDSSASSSSTSSTSSSSISNGRESVAATPAAGMTEASTNKVVATDIPPKQVFGAASHAEAKEASKGRRPIQ